MRLGCDMTWPLKSFLTTCLCLQSLRASSILRILIKNSEQKLCLGRTRERERQKERKKEPEREREAFGTQSWCIFVQVLIWIQCISLMLSFYSTLPSQGFVPPHGSNKLLVLFTLKSLNLNFHPCSRLAFTFEILTNLLSWLYPLPPHFYDIFCHTN